MPGSVRRYLAVPLLVAVALMSLLTLAAPPASANPGLQVSGALLLADVSPG